MNVEDFVRIIGADFYTGVPDSQLKPLCDFVYNTYKTDPKHHIIAANEGNAVGIAAGYYMATGKTPVVYMQNSGEGNVINPLASLVNENVYGIPLIFVIGWRGEPGVHDEPQHVFQGEITCKMLELMNVEYTVISGDTSVDTLFNRMEAYRNKLNDGHSVAFVIRKGALTYEKSVTFGNGFNMTRECTIERIIEFAGDDFIVCTTGKAGRELFEIREKRGENHDHDFLTVGSMGHASSIALGMAIHCDRRVWCIDGDGSLLMHMGALTVIGACKPKSFVHIVINNEAHESVGGMPTVAGEMDLCSIARACGYQEIYRVENETELDTALKKALHHSEVSFIEVRCSLGSRKDLGRPTISPSENKKGMMSVLEKM